MLIADTHPTCSKLQRAYTYSDTIKHLAVYANFVNNSQKGVWLIMHFDEIIYFNACHML